MQVYSNFLCQGFFLGGGAFFNAIWYFAKLEFDIIVRGKIYQGQSKTSQTVEFAGTDWRSTILEGNFRPKR